METLEAASEDWGIDRKEIECQNCGSRSSIPPESLTHTCAFCGSNKVIQRPAPAEELRPRFLVPFKIDSVECVAIVKKWLGSSWMVVKDLRNLASLARFTAVYLPFWTFDAQARAA